MAVSAAADFFSGEPLVPIRTPRRLSVPSYDNLWLFRLTEKS
jgi:hypothetical protein